MRELHAIFRGNVQGVGFRWTVVEYAEKRGLVGTTRNLSDGTVEVIAQGSQEALEAFLADLKSHSGFARIDSVKARYCEPTPSYPDFRIIK